MRDHFTIATRGSKLALWQAEHVRACLLALHPDLRIDLRIIKTKGDIIQDVPLARIGGKGLFVKEIEEALIQGEADLAVHSVKDVPMDLPDGLLLGCVPKREVPVDAFVSYSYPTLEALPEGGVLGTSSLRRQAQLLNSRHDLVIRNLRGNVDTRLRKLKEGEFDAIILAKAALLRLGLHAPYEASILPTQMLPAVGQGALGIECREDAYDVLVLLAELEDSETRVCIEAERAFLRRLNGGCQVPIGGYARMEGENLLLTGLLAEVDGSKLITDTLSGDPVDCEKMGNALAESLLERGGREILAKLYAS